MDNLKQELLTIVRRKSGENKNKGKNKSDGEDSTKRNKESTECSPTPLNI